VAALVSVLIPAYNAEGTIAETLDSVLGQTYTPLEIIVVDDGSGDGTLEVARGYETHGVRVIEQEINRGQTATLNRALAEATGEFIQYLDADDVLDPRKIEVQVDRLSREPSGTLATSPWARFYFDDLSTARFVRSPDWRDYDRPIDWIVDHWNGRGTMPPGSWLYPRSIVDSIGPWHESLSLNNDMEYFARAVLASPKIAYCEEARWYYRSGNPSLSARKDDRALRSQFEVIRLSTSYLLDAEDSHRTRHACACFWQTFLYLAYPSVPELRRSAEREIERLGGGSIKPDGGPAFRILRDLLGWKAAMRMRSGLHALRPT
jgi:glycosyltransferase involved in cell wall biosynthesis